MISSIDSGDDDLDDVGLVESTVASAAITTTEGEPEAAHAQERHDKAGTSRIDDYDTDDGLPPMLVLPEMDGGRRSIYMYHTMPWPSDRLLGRPPATTGRGGTRNWRRREACTLT